MERAQTQLTDASWLEAARRRWRQRPLLRAWWRIMLERVLHWAQDRLLQSQGMTLETIPRHFLHRLRFAGVPDEVTAELLPQIRRMSDWSTVLEPAGDTFAEQGKPELAFALYYMAQRPIVEPTEQKTRICTKSFEQFLRVPHVAPVEQLELDHNGERVGAILQVPQASTERCPVVLILTGVGATKEEVYPLAQAFLREGFAVCSIDLHGYGHTKGALCSTSIWLGATVMRHLARDPRLDPERQHLMGYCLGGLYALWAAAVEAPSSLTIVSGPFRPHVYTHRLESLVRGQFQQMMVGRPVSHYWQMTRSGQLVAISGEIVAHRITAPTFLYFGGKDRMVRADEMEAIAAAVSGPAELTLYASERHACLGRIDEIAAETVEHMHALDAQEQAQEQAQRAA